MTVTEKEASKMKPNFWKYFFTWGFAWAMLSTIAFGIPAYLGNFSVSGFVIVTVLLFLVMGFFFAVGLTEKMEVRNQ